MHRLRQKIIGAAFRRCGDRILVAKAEIMSPRSELRSFIETSGKIATDH